MNREGSNGGEQQRMVVVGADKGTDRNETLAAGTILHHDWLAPARSQTIREQPRRDVDTAGGTKRKDELDRSRGIGLRAGEARDGGQRGRSRGEMQKSTTGKFHDAASWKSFSPLPIGTLWNVPAGAGITRLDVRRSDHFAPPLGFFRHEFSEVSGQSGINRRTSVGKP